MLLTPPGRSLTATLSSSAAGPHRGEHAARSQDAICLTACPKHRSQYSWTISYAAVSHRGTWAIFRMSGSGRKGGGLCVQDLGWGGMLGGSRHSWQGWMRTC